MQRHLMATAHLPTTAKGGCRTQGLSTGQGDAIRPFVGASVASSALREAGFDDVTLREFPGGHELRAEELRSVIVWWL